MEEWQEHLGALSALGLGAATVFVAWSSFYRPVDPLMSEDAEPVPIVAAAAPAVREPLRDAPAAMTASPMPIPEAGYAARAFPKPTAPAAVPAVPAGEAKAAASPAYRSLLSDPAGYMLRRTTLGSARGLRRFLADKRAVDGYLDSPLVRLAMRSPTFTKAFLRNGPVVRAFLDTPALRDPAAVSELVRSPLFRKLTDTPGVQEAIADPAVMTRLATDPETVSFMAEHPQVMAAIRGAAPSLRAAFAR